MSTKTIFKLKYLFLEVSMSINEDDKHMEIPKVPPEKLKIKESINQDAKSEFNWQSLFFGVSFIFIIIYF